MMYELYIIHQCIMYEVTNHISIISLVYQIDCRSWIYDSIDISCKCIFYEEWCYICRKGMFGSVMISHVYRSISDVTDTMTAPTSQMKKIVPDCVLRLTRPGSLTVVSSKRHLLLQSLCLLYSMT